MGLFRTIQTLFTSGNRQVEIIVLGLDNSGKTTLINKLKQPDAQSSNIVPTVGYNVERFIASNMIFSAYDMSGQSRYRNLWETQYKIIHGIIFIVDSSDRLRLAVARDEMWMLLDHKDLISRRIPLLIFSNKADLNNSMSAAEVHLSLGLDLIRNRNWNIISSCAVSGEGLVAGIDWLATNIKEYLHSVSS